MQFAVRDTFNFLRRQVNCIKHLNSIQIFKENANGSPETREFLQREYSLEYAKIAFVDRTLF